MADVLKSSVAQSSNSTSSSIKKKLSALTRSSSTVFCLFFLPPFLFIISWLNFFHSVDTWCVSTVKSPTTGLACIFPFSCKQIFFACVQVKCCCVNCVSYSITWFLHQAFTDFNSGRFPTVRNCEQKPQKSFGKNLLGSFLGACVKEAETALQHINADLRPLCEGGGCVKIKAFKRINKVSHYQIIRADHSDRSVSFTGLSKKH